MCKSTDCLNRSNSPYIVLRTKERWPRRMDIMVLDDEERRKGRGIYHDGRRIDTSGFWFRVVTFYFVLSLFFTLSG